MKIRRLFWGSVIISIVALLVVYRVSIVRPQPETISPEIGRVLDHISEDSLRGHLSFIASDFLEGRFTPSPGLDIAAEYIAAQFRCAGLEPAGDDGYFQTASLKAGENFEVSNSAEYGTINAEGLFDGKRPLKLRNVVGLLRGSDPILKETYVLVTAHYDHVGVKSELKGDNIFNGANDNGSGTVSVIEIASALATLKTRPKRSILFMTLFGEERGLLGSRYYVRYPVFPLKKTVANINLEHLGRTDSPEGSQSNRVTLTGFDYSDLGPIFKRAGELIGIEVYKHPQHNDSFFARSDNQALADTGVPAHTLCVSLLFPDYHQVGDHWDKIDYPNLARTNRMIALALIMIANNPVAPQWNVANQRTARYVKAWKKLQEESTTENNK